ANNQYAYSTPNDRQFACENLVDRALGYGIKGHECDGTDLKDCLEVFSEAVKRARAGDGPQLVVGSLLRLSGHGEHDAGDYVDPALKRGSVGRDCLDVAKNILTKQGWASVEECSGWKTEASSKVDQALSKIAKDPLPDGARETWYALSTKHLCEGLSDL
ncbi:MAG: thiamine pyrophosphate-dependent enzyme, partial [Verrucomicrobiota bacterium]